MTISNYHDQLQLHQTRVYFYHPTLAHAETYIVNLIARQLHNCHWSFHDYLVTRLFRVNMYIYVLETVNGDLHLHPTQLHSNVSFSLVLSFSFSLSLSVSLFRYFPFPYRRSIAIVVRYVRVYNTILIWFYLLERVLAAQLAMGN